MPNWIVENVRAVQNPESTVPAIVLVWTVLGIAMLFLIWSRGRTWARQLFALATLGFREGLRLKILWTVLLLSLIPGAIAYFSDADGTHAGRARLILDTCIASGELLGASLIVLLSALSVAREIESRIMHTIGAKPVPRWTILTGKALGFWAIDLCFLAILVAYCGLLVRAVPLRAETNAHAGIEVTGTWGDLERNALTTRIYQNAAGSTVSAADYLFVRPGATREWVFSAPSENDTLWTPRHPSTGERSLRFTISSNNSMFAFVPDVRITAAAAGQKPFLDRTVTVPAGKPFEFYFDPGTMPNGVIKVTVTAAQHPATSRLPPISLIVPRANGIRLGVAGDGFAWNLLKSFVLMAIQGWVLAIITASWSGVLSFPVTVALGMVFVLGGEMSRNVIDLLDRDPSRTTANEKIDILKAKLGAQKAAFDAAHQGPAYIALAAAVDALPSLVDEGSDGSQAIGSLIAQINTLRIPLRESAAKGVLKDTVADDLIASLSGVQEALLQNELNANTRYRVRTALKMLPDFRAAGGPGAFVEGQFLPLLALAHTALWMGLIRGIGWALPGFVAFQRREVGK